MKKIILLVSWLLFISITAIGKPINLLNKISPAYTDTLPDMCWIVPATILDSLNPFGTPLSASFPDELNYDVYRGCYYQFFTPTIKPQIAIKLLKWSSKQEAAIDYKTNIDRHTSDWYGRPERIYGIADSAYFNYEGEDTAKCDECGLVALKGLYTIYISYKGAYDESPRQRKKVIALIVLGIMYDRYDILSPRIRNRRWP
jgi:hypothetical protein